MLVYELLIVTILTWLLNRHYAAADLDIRQNHSNQILTVNKPDTSRPTGEEVGKENEKEELKTRTTAATNATTGTACVDELRLAEIITRNISELFSSLRNKEIQPFKNEISNCGKDTELTNRKTNGDKLKDRDDSPGITPLNNQNEKLVNVIKGEKGERGPPGLPGPPGPIGDVFDSAERRTTQIIPEVTTTKPENSRNLANSNQRSNNQGKFGNGEKMGPEADIKVAKSTVNMVTVESKNFIQEVSEKTIGTLLYIIDEDAVLIRMKNGWRYLQLRSTLIVSSQLPVSCPKETPVSEYKSSLRLAALNEPHPGNLNGLEDADRYCAKAANHAKLNSTFKAFLSSKNQNIRAIVPEKYHDLPIRNLKDEILSCSWKQMFNDGGSYVLPNRRIISFDGRNALNDRNWPIKAAWHGSTKEGYLTEFSCNSWKSDSKYRLGLATNFTKAKLLGEEDFTCNQLLMVLCIEVTPRLPRQ